MKRIYLFLQCRQQARRHRNRILGGNLEYAAFYFGFGYVVQPSHRTGSSKAVRGSGGKKIASGRDTEMFKYELSKRTHVLLMCYVTYLSIIWLNHVIVNVNFWTKAQFSQCQLDIL